MNGNRQRGFTLVEVIVVAGIIAVLAGILVPLIFKEIDEAKTTRAAADIRSISAAILILRKDTGQWPVSGTCLPSTTLLYGAGTLPSLGTGWSIMSAFSYDVTLAQDSGCGTSWKGPYMASVNADPWGYTYITNADAMVATGKPQIWILSAGPDGVVQTAATDNTLQGDDIGVRLQ